MYDLTHGVPWHFLEKLSQIRPRSNHVMATEFADLPDTNAVGRCQAYRGPAP